MPRFFSWTGRLSRGEWILQWLGLILLNIVTSAAIAAWGFASDRAHNEAGSIAAGISFAVALVLAAVLMSFPTVKRFHDLGWHGALYLLFLIPGINFLVIVPLVFFRGSRGANRYGPDPLRRQAATFFLDNYPEQAEASFPGLDRSAQQRAIEESIETLFRQALTQDPQAPKRALARESVQRIALSLGDQAGTTAGREFWSKLWSSVEFAVY